jgi:immune inhibitor A
MKTGRPRNVLLLACVRRLLVAAALMALVGGCLQPSTEPEATRRVSGQADTLPLSEHRTGALPLPSLTTRPETTGFFLPSDLPARDLADLAGRILPSSSKAGPTSSPPGTPYSLGQKQRFWISDQRDDGRRLITATLKCATPHLYMWLEDGLEVSSDDLLRSALEFEERTYPANRRYFGEEWSPGIDGDVHLSVLNARFGGASGYFNSADEYPRRVYPYSNEREMFYINVDAALPGTNAYQSTLAHEFQHLIHWHADPNEDAWVNEGASELATSLNGFKKSGRIAAFTRRPDTQLDTWGDQPDNVYEHYGAAHLMLLYFYERFGEDMLRGLVACQDKGIAGFNSVLALKSDEYCFVDLYADWVICNLLDNASILGGKYGYRTLGNALEVVREGSFSEYPVVESHTVHQFGTDYFELLPDEAGSALTIEFDGADEVHLVGNQPYGGRYLWWSNRGDLSDTTLTRSFDLRGLEQATLEFALWHDIEDGWDYAYVEASADGGKRWHILRGEHSTDSNPNGNSYGWAYTGISGQGRVPHWVREQVDLTPYAGQQIEVRFEYVTDDAINREGLCVDDIAIPELGYVCGAEDGDGGWRAAGFVRSDNTLTQSFSVQVVQFCAEDGSVELSRVFLTESQEGRVLIKGLGSGIERVVLAVSGLTPVTTELAAYEFRIHP